MAKNKQFGSSIMGVKFGDSIDKAAEDVRGKLGMAGELRYIPADKIRFSPYNEGLDSDQVQDYASSMSENGMIEPIVVYDMGDDTYEILSGHRRFNAWCKVLKHDTIKAVIREYEKDPLKRFKAHTEANSITREKDLKFWQSRIALAKQVLRETGWSGTREEEIKVLGEMLGGVSRMNIIRFESFERLIPELQEFESRKWLSAHTLYAAASLSPVQQKEVASRVMDMFHTKEPELIETAMDFEISREEFNAIVREVKSGKKPAARKHPTFTEKANGAARSFLKAVGSAKTEADKKEALRQINAIRLELEVLEEKYLSEQ